MKEKRKIFSLILENRTGTVYTKKKDVSVRRERITL
jgi:hypothetical protein